MNDSWAIGRPGRRMIGTELKFASSSVSVPFQPGSQNPAVACTTSPSRPSELLPSMRATTSSGSSTHSSVRPRQNSPGWMTNVPPSSISTCSVSSDGGSPRSTAVIRWLWKTRNELPSRRSTLAGWTMPGSHGSMRMRPSSTRRRIVPSDSTEVAVMRPVWQGGWTPPAPEVLALCAIGATGARDYRAHARRRERQGVAVRAAARLPRADGAWVPRLTRRHLRAAAAPVADRSALLGRGADRPPHDRQERDDRDLEDEHQVDERPTHAQAMLPLAAGTRTRRCPVPTEGGEERRKRARPSLAHAWHRHRHDGAGLEAGVRS